MIKIGHAWVDMNAVSAVCENRSEPGWSLFLNSGRIVGLPDVTEADVIQALERCGLSEEDGENPPASFSEAEYAELHRAYVDGYFWAAQDSNGHTYAYTEKPEKGSFAWRSEAAGILRLKAGDYDALSFEDAEPLELAALFAQEDAEDDGSDQ